MFLDEFLDYGEPVPPKKVETKLEAFKICDHCNLEYPIKFGIFVEDLVSTIQTCPHCGQSDHCWIKIKR